MTTTTKKVYFTSELDGMTYHLTKSEARKRAREEWPEVCRREEEETELIEKYAYKVLGEKPRYEMAFEEVDEYDTLVEQEQKKKIDETSENIELEMTSDPDKIKRARRTMKEMYKQHQADMALRNNNPTHVLRHKSDKLSYMCKCTGELLRNGRLCEICKLTKNVHDYMMNLFKDAAEGRSTVV